MHSFLWILICVLLSITPALAQWQPQNSGTDADFRGLCAVSAQVAWASGTRGTVLRTVDGGKRWEKVNVPGAESLDFRDIQAFDAQEAFVLSIGPGESSRIYKTTDGGKHWRLLFTNPDAKAFYDGFAFWDRKHAIAMSDSVDGKFPLLTTEDGETWKPLIPRALPPALPNEGGFAASGTCIAVSGKSDVWFVTGGPEARVFHSADRGVHWEVVTTPLLSGAPSRGIFSIAFQDRRNGVIVGGDYSVSQAGERTAAYTRDGGKTWMLAEKCPAGFRSAAAFLPGATPMLWIAVGTSGSDSSRDGGKTWQSFDTGNVNAVSFVDSHTGWAVGPKGKIARFAPAPRK
jgi:photosystem II stability/assembly factor-like uncharacterized protein